MRPARPRPSKTPAVPAPILHVQCPRCHSPKAVVAATHYDEMMCFCPACEHVWDCPAAPAT
jgi:hypothetical protein